MYVWPKIMQALLEGLTKADKKLAQIVHSRTSCAKKFKTECIHSTKMTSTHLNEASVSMSHATHPHMHRTEASGRVSGRSEGVVAPLGT